ncbi:hypothetical protein [Bacteroides sp. 519]|uniref:hypothetical protein n=1 Tax=Bacteroides sp. 519 TaxID=2302937 RepID=UPI0013D590D4|nr:hypothetical protein [Bacteroides sp. 519]NDV59672.1 hypothetical protein [Bacteroides sp. 519]
MLQKRIISIILLITVSNSTVLGQNSLLDSLFSFVKKNNEVEVDIDLFDIDKFEKNKKGNIYEYQEKGQRIVLTDLGNWYRKTIYYKNGVFEDHINYYKKELTVRMISRRFYTMYVGKIRYFNAFGNLEKELDTDLPFPYSIYDLATWIEETHGVNILQYREGYRVDRSENPYPHYMVRFITQDGKPVLYSIDGTNGEVFFQDINGEEKEIKPFPSLNN